jgi:hypothetical protein
MRFLDLALCSFLFVIAIVILLVDARDLHDFRKMQSEATSPFDAHPPLKFVSGYDADGREISTLPLGHKRLVLFMLHGSSFQQDVDFWNAMAAHATAELGFAGMCDGANCTEKITLERGKLHFTALINGDYLALRGLMKLDSQEQVEVLDRETSVVKIVPRPKSSNEFAEIVANHKVAL